MMKRVSAVNEDIFQTLLEKKNFDFSEEEKVWIEDDLRFLIEEGKDHHEIRIHEKESAESEKEGKRRTRSESFLHQCVQKLIPLFGIDEDKISYVKTTNFFPGSSADSEGISGFPLRPAGIGCGARVLTIFSAPLEEKKEEEKKEKKEEEKKEEEKKVDREEKKKEEEKLSILALAKEAARGREMNHFSSTSSLRRFSANKKEGGSREVIHFSASGGRGGGSSILLSEGTALLLPIGLLQTFSVSFDAKNHAVLPPTRAGMRPLQIRKNPLRRIIVVFDLILNAEMLKKAVSALSEVAAENGGKKMRKNLIKKTDEFLKKN